MPEDIAFVNARILTLEGPPAARRGHEMHELAPIERGWIHVRGGQIAGIGSGSGPDEDFQQSTRVVDVEGRVILPAFVDCHTHACWAGDRYDEFDMKLEGASYLDILNAGGGIMSTVRAVRSASRDELVALLLRRLDRIKALGTGTVEIKSGYGLTLDDELKMLEAIRAARGRSDLDVVTTFLGAHALDPENPDFVEQTIRETLPAVVEAFPGITCDAYCEEGAWSLEQVRQLFEEAQSLGCPLRVHADQFHSLGMTRLAVEMGAVSVDHLEASTATDLEHLARSATIGVVLPCTGFHLDDRYAPARALVDADGALAIATNYNPGSSPTPSMPFTIALACRKLRLTPAEAIVASTFNAACVLSMEHEIGSLEVGKRADLQVLDAVDERELGYEFAVAGPELVMVEGRFIHRRDGRSTLGRKIG